MNEKRCSKCLENKPLSQFYRHNQSPDGYRPDCKACGHKPARKVTAQARFWSKVKTGPDCWEWQAGAATNNGYGRFWISKERGHEVAHRYSWELQNGPVPDGMSVCHHCDNPLCVRPDHLFLGTHAENIQDAVGKGKIATLSPGDVRLVRGLRRRGLTQQEVAERLGVSRTTISHIDTGATWGWLK